eukprot:gene20103-19252_t
MFATSRLIQSASRLSSRAMAANFSTSAAAQKIEGPPMVFIKGEEMTRYCMELIMDKWINPRVDTSKWEYFDLSCVGRDNSDDQELHDAVSAGARIGAIFKEPTITPTEVQQKKLGLKRAYGSPNGAMRGGWNGITISRDTIHIEGLQLGYTRPVLFERHAVGGEYGAKHAIVGPGTVKATFYPEDGGEPVLIDDRKLTDEQQAVVLYHNPLDNVTDLAHHFFKRCLDAKHYKQQYIDAGLLDGCNNELQHLISDAATMQIIRWTDGGFGMMAHNYDGDMLTDEVSQVHRSPGFITSNLIGKRDDGVMIMEFEASHGTVADMWEDHLNGKPTSLNPLGMVEALIGAMQHAGKLDGGRDDIQEFTLALRGCMHRAMASGKGTQD